MEKKLKQFMDSYDLNIFEMIDLAIQVASRLYPAEFSLRRDRIIEGIYSSPNARGEDLPRFSSKKAHVAKKGCAESSQFPATGHSSPLHQRGLNGAKRNAKMQVSEKLGACARNTTLKIGEVPSQHAQGNSRHVPVGTNQGHLPSTKGKGKVPCTESEARHAVGFNKRNDQIRSYDMKGENSAPPAKKVKKHGGTCSKSISIGDDKVGKKINSTNRGLHGSCRRDTGDQQGLEPDNLDDLIKTSDDNSGAEETQNPLDWWKDDSNDSDDNVDVDKDYAKGDA